MSENEQPVEPVEDLPDPVDPVEPDPPAPIPPMVEDLSTLPTDFEPPSHFRNEHSQRNVGGPGGVVNYPEETWPEGFDPDADYASPKVEDI